MIRCFKFGIIINGVVVNYIDIGKVIFINNGDIMTVHLFNTKTNKHMGQFGFSGKDKKFFNKFTEYLKKNNISYKEEATDKYANLPVEKYDKMPMSFFDTKSPK